MNGSPENPTYFCPKHAEPLVQVASEARCSQCPAPYPILGGIWMLDLINRPDRAAFDEQVVGSPIPLEATKGARILAAAGNPSLRDANILDVGCGLGDLSYGLAQSPTVSNSNIYAFDHSLESLRLAAALRFPENGNRVHFSAQDALHLFFADRSFDLVAGTAVVHHFLDYPGFLREAARILKPGGIAVFAEPFFDGYFWPTLFLKTAIEECGLDFRSPEFSVASVLEIVPFMARHRGNTPMLANMTDKHYFRESEVLVAANDAGFNSVRFHPYEPSDFYAGWISVFLDIYGVTHPEVRRLTIDKYNRAAALAGPLLPDLMAHFKYIVLRKA